eukprot:XP_011609954.1 PREDICTED: LOW QUALITY PROTEIN: oligodendrocyte-myelin glycoprotein [Takifugu rubripes]
MRRLVLPNTGPSAPLLELLCVLLSCSQALAECPSVCFCSRNHRDVDCSCKALRRLPDGLQLNLVSLNLSHNRFLNLDGQLTVYTHLRFLDLSHNWLSHLPAGLPRSLWQLHASSNRLKSLSKNDTVHQWNLRLLDLSANRLERATFINNTLTSLSLLNLSHNHFWTIPTNLPVNLKTIDLSHNFLFLVLPGSLDRLPRLAHFHLHHNRFSTLPFGALDKLVSLSVVTLWDNPWACHQYGNISYLISWSQQTPANVLGCPCSTQPVCGGLHLGRGEGQHYAHMPTEANVTEWLHFSSSSQPNTPSTPKGSSCAPRQPLTSTPNVSVSSKSSHQSVEDWLFTERSSTRVKKTPTLGTRRKNQAIPNSNAPNFTTGCLLFLLHQLGLLPFLQQHFL